MRVLSKQGRPFLLLPPDRRAACSCLELYPAQTGRARLARLMLRWLFRAGKFAATESLSLSVCPDAPFAKYLSGLAGTPEGQIPMLGVLAGNPAHDSRRFLVLVFDAHRRPAAVAKVGLTASARDLIRKENGFLQTAPSQTQGIPKILGSFHGTDREAFALSFLAGHSPRPDERGAMAGLLRAWINPQRLLTVLQTAAWARLERSGACNGPDARLAQQLAVRIICSVIHHGDFAPWNIKVNGGRWSVVDWERGEMDGIAGWDWFHYVLQTGILVQRKSTRMLLEEVEEMFQSELFRTYAKQAGIAGIERELLQAYLLHLVGVIKPAEGLAQAQDLLQALSKMSN